MEIAQSQYKKLEYDAGRKEHRFYTVILSVVVVFLQGRGVCIIHTPSQDIHIRLNTLFPFPKIYRMGTSKLDMW